MYLNTLSYPAFRKLFLIDSYKYVVHVKRMFLLTVDGKLYSTSVYNKDIKSESTGLYK